MYEVERVVGGFQVWHREENRPVDDEKVYPSRQNAYVRRDQLNEHPRGRVFTITISLKRKDCYEATQVLKKTFGGMGIDYLVIDPLSDLAPELREITFKYRCASPEPKAQVQRLRFSRLYPPLSEVELLAKLEELAEVLPIVSSLSISPAINTEDRGEIERLPYHAPYSDDHLF